QLVADARGQCRLREVVDQRRHLGTAGQLAQHLLQLLLHLRKLLLKRLEVGRAALLGLEIASKFGFPALQVLEFGALGTRHHVPEQAEDQGCKQHAEADLVLTRPRTHVVEVEFPQRYFLLAHWAAPWAGADSAAGSSAGSSAMAGSPSGVAAATGVAAAGSALTGGTGSGMPSPSSSFGAFGLASCTDSTKA